MRGMKKTEFSTCVYIYIYISSNIYALWLRNFVWFFGFDESCYLGANELITLQSKNEKDQLG